MSQPAESGNRTLHAIYREIQQHRDACLTRILRVLEPKATTDPEIAAVVTLLEPWLASRQEPVSSPPSAPSTPDAAQEEDPCADREDHQEEQGRTERTE
jgi:hypothetical protein